MSMFSKIFLSRPAQFPFVMNVHDVHDLLLSLFW
jgi:hypothetical protein